MKAKKLSGIMTAVIITAQFLGTPMPVMAEDLILDEAVSGNVSEKDTIQENDLDFSGSERFVIEDVGETATPILMENEASYLNDVFSYEEPLDGTLDCYGADLSGLVLCFEDTDGNILNQIIYLAAGESITIKPIFCKEYYNEELDICEYTKAADVDITGVTFHIDDSEKEYWEDKCKIDCMETNSTFTITKIKDENCFLYVYPMKNGESIGWSEIDLFHPGYTETPPKDEFCKWDEGTITKEPSCSEEGEIVYKCTIDGCNEVRKDTLPKKEHTPSAMVKENEIKASCTTGGCYDEVVYCSVCTNEISRNTITVEKTAHAPSGTVKENEINATCTKNGSYDDVVYCSICSNEISRNTVTVLAKGEHEYKGVVTKPTCTAIGFTTYTCTCGDTYTADETTALGHTYSDWKETTAATLFKEGVETRACSRCKDTQTRSISKLKGTIKPVSSSLTIKLKKSVALTDMIKGLSNGDSVNINKCTSSKTSVAYIKNGKVVAKKTGSTVIRIETKSGASTSVTIKVQKGTVKTTNISVENKKVSLNIGKTYTLKPAVTPITSTQKVSYKSSNKKVAIVSSSGKITAKKAGTATITVKSGSKSVKITVTVKSPAVESIKLSVTNKTLKVGKSFTLKTTLLPKYSKGTVKYTTSDKKIATVSKTGKVKAKKKGSVTITAKVGNISKTCKITVK